MTREQGLSYQKMAWVGKSVWGSETLEITQTKCRITNKRKKFTKGNRWTLLPVSTCTELSRRNIALCAGTVEFKYVGYSLPNYTLLTMVVIHLYTVFSGVCFITLYHEVNGSLTHMYWTTRRNKLSKMIIIFFYIFLTRRWLTVMRGSEASRRAVYSQTKIRRQRNSWNCTIIMRSNSAS